MAYYFPSDVVVQGHRGDIIEGLGCVPTTYNVTLAYPLFYIWPPIISLIAVIYGCLSFRIFLKRRKTADALFTGAHMYKEHHLRLLWFSIVPLSLMFPLSVYILALYIILKPHPWISWEDTHLNFNRFERVPAVVPESNPYIYASWVIHLWGCTLCWALFFAFFGMGSEQRKRYHRWSIAIVRTFGIKPPSSSVDSREQLPGPSPLVQPESTPTTSDTTTAPIPHPMKLDLAPVTNVETKA